MLGDILIISLAMGQFSAIELFCGSAVGYSKNHSV